MRILLLVNYILLLNTTKRGKNTKRKCFCNRGKMPLNSHSISRCSTVLSPITEILRKEHIDFHIRKRGS